jgi:acylphosphatase
VADKKKCIVITITGDLRGRGLRGSAMYMAFSLGIRGFVEYNHAGGIVLEAEGDEENLEKFIAWLRTFIQPWKISDFSFVETTPKGYSSFEIHTNFNDEGPTVNKSYAARSLILFWMRIRRMLGSDKHQISQKKINTPNYPV